MALDGRGAELHGGRYTPAGLPVVSLASEAGLAVLVALRYLPASRAQWPTDHVLGWTDVDAPCLRLAATLDEGDLRASATQWLSEGCGLLLAIPSRVLPEADVVLLNPRHPDAARVAPLDCRPFDFAQCLHRPPMLERFGDSGRDVTS